ncbi:MAG TPA: ACP S-malonyltransferase [Dongiaceae bacterium]
MTRAFVFPGQGSQAVGMGRALAEAFAPAREVFEEVDDALGQRLTRLMFEGPESDLTLTENTQPALMAVSLAVMRVLEREGGFRAADKLAFVAGHSLGEYSALAAAGALDVAEAAQLLKRRGQAMQKAVPVGEGAMAALLGVDLPAAQEIAAAAAADTKEVCATANDNAPGQVVVSGSKKAIDRVVVIAPEKGAKRAVLLPVSAPFHCPLMQPAADAMEEALAGAKIGTPAVPLVANVTARHVSDPDTIRGLLVKQVTGMVRWRESVAYMKEQGVDKITEIGTGKVLAGLAKRIDREIDASSVGEPADIEALLKML